VNTIFSWKDLDFRLKLTTAHYFTPSGRTIERRHSRNGSGPPTGGIGPDREVPLDEKLEENIAARLAEHEVPERHRQAVAALSARTGIRVPEPIGPDGDAQLAAAIEVLRERIAAAGNR
jgi:hypothetical protein